MKWLARIGVVGTLMISIFCTGGAWARSEIAFGLNYTRLTLDADLEFLTVEEITQLDEDNGIGGEIRYSRSILPVVTQLRLGFGVLVSHYRTDGENAPPLFTIERERYLAIMPETQLSWRQPVGAGLFVEAGAGAGPVFGNYRATGVTVTGTPISDIDEWAVGLGVRPFVRVGWTFTRLVVGVEAAYRWTWIEYDEIDGRTREFTAGVFAGLRL